MSAVRRTVPYLDFSRRSELMASIAAVIHMGRESEVQLAAAQYVQQQRGSTMLVERQLSDELLASDVSGISADDIVLLQPSMELVWEDPGIPGMLFYCKDDEYWRIARAYFSPEVEFQSWPKLTYCLDWFDSETVCHTMQLPSDELSSWLAGSSTPVVMRGMESDLENVDAVKQYFMLCVKLFLYCSIPEYRPVGIKDLGGPLKRAQIKLRGGRRKVYYARLPAVVSHGRETYVNGDGVRTVKAHRRRGVFRMLRSPKFKNKQGQLVYVRPCLIHGGGVGGVLYRATTRTKEQATG